MFILHTNRLVRRRFLCVHCTVTTDLLMWYSNTQNDFSHGVAIFSLHILASPRGRNAYYDEKQLPGKKNFLNCSFYLYRFHKYVSYGFPTKKFCKPRVHYEMPCISSVTVSSSNRHLVCAGRLLSRYFFLNILAIECENDCLSQNRSQNMFNYSVSFHQKNARWSNINVFCDINSENIV